jgi:hypothetical protein
MGESRIKCHPFRNPLYIPRYCIDSWYDDPFIPASGGGGNPLLEEVVVDVIQKEAESRVDVSGANVINRQDIHLNHFDVTNRHVDQNRWQNHDMGLA